MVAISKRQNSAWTWLLWHTGGDNMTPSATSCRNTAVNSSRSPAATWQGQSHNTNSQGILQQKAALRHQLFVLQHICCAVLCCAVLCCAVLCCAVLCCSAWAVLCPAVRRSTYGRMLHLYGPTTDTKQAMLYIRWTRDDCWLLPGIPCHSAMTTKMHFRDTRRPSQDPPLLCIR